MRRLLLLGLLAVLLMAPAARAASINQIIRDCADDGVLEGHYSPGDLRKALRHLPTDVAEYTSCTDVLSRAATAAASARATGPALTRGGPASTSSTAPPAPAATPADNVTPATPQDTLALEAASHAPRPTVQDHNRSVPVELSATVGRNPLPSSLTLLVVLLGAALLVIAFPAVRRVLTRRRR
jgi:hypothetical protein